MCQIILLSLDDARLEALTDAIEALIDNLTSTTIFLLAHTSISRNFFRPLFQNVFRRHFETNFALFSFQIRSWLFGLPATITASTSSFHKLSAQILPSKWLSTFERSCCFCTLHYRIIVALRLFILN